MAKDEFKEEVFRVRELCEALKTQLHCVQVDTANGVFDMSRASDPAEIMANLTLAYRHIEDARMRLGKAVQAYEGKDILPR